MSFAVLPIKTVRGTVSSSWKRDARSSTLQVTIPVNARATVSVPKMGLENVTVTEGGTMAWQAGSYLGGVAGIAGGSESTNYVTFDVGSGSYSFQLTGTLAQGVSQNTI